MENKSYIITDGSKYLLIDKMNKPSITTNADIATKFEEDKANKYLKNNLPQKKSEGWCVLHMVESKHKKCKKCNTEIQIEKPKEEEIDFEKTIQNFSDNISMMRKVNLYLNSKISYYDIKVSEYYHLIEEIDPPAHVMMQIYKKYKQCLQERRYYKKQHAKMLSIDHLLKNHGLNASVTTKECGGTFSTFKPTILIEEYKEYKKYLAR